MKDQLRLIRKASSGVRQAIRVRRAAALRCCAGYARSRQSYAAEDESYARYDHDRDVLAEYQDTEDDRDNTQRGPVFKIGSHLAPEIGHRERRTVDAGHRDIP